jgi:hypothetical protein
MPRPRGVETEAVSSRIPKALKEQWVAHCEAHSQIPGKRLEQLIRADLTGDFTALITHLDTETDTHLSRVAVEGTASAAGPSVIQQIVDATPTVTEVAHRHTRGEIVDEKHDNGVRYVRARCATCTTLLSWRKA